MTNKPFDTVPKRQPPVSTHERSDDRRVRRTKRALGVALADLMVADEFNAIMKRAPFGMMMIVLASSACRVGEKAHVDTSATAVPHADSSASSPSPVVASPWAVTDSGAGALRIGMTRDQLALDLHATPPKHTRADSGCAYLAVAGIPPGMRTMWVAATLTRIDISAASLPTDRGAKVGDKQTRIESLYRGRVFAMPAKYDPRGKYLVVRPTPPADSTRRIVFETDSTARVTRYRVGREPEVEWVEGCS